MSNDFSTSRPIRIHSRAGVAEQAHVFDDACIIAIRAALAARRPLLVRGEPGVGKTQLAVAAAQQLGRRLFPFVVNAQTESTDLLYHYDSVRRLAEAQICAALKLSSDEARKAIDVRRFIVPGPLWWGFNQSGAQQQLRIFESDSLDQNQSGDDTTPPTNEGAVVLIDEIDKADTDVPNGLLEALGAGEFTPFGCDQVEAQEPGPLVVVTSNEERALPDAFVRRCLVLHLTLPLDESDLTEYLVVRGRAHFQKTDEADDFDGPEVADDSLELAAKMLCEDRLRTVPPLPGLAEYLDLIRAARNLHKDGRGEIGELLESVRRFTLKKHQETIR